MSGGVDSSVAAARVSRSGRHAFGVTLAMWPASREQVRDRGCCSIDAVEDARRVAASLGMPHYVWNLERDFDELVVRDFEDAYASGTTPNPCVRCNQTIKFGVLLQRVRAIGATHLATGHYARTGRRGPQPTLHRSREPRRDQSYVLHRLAGDALARAVFPLGTAASKLEVRAEAEALGLTTAAKPESQDLCFVEGTTRDELRRRLAGRYSPGAVVDRHGDRLGVHQGLPFLTVGQRSGLGIDPSAPDATPLYVIELRHETNTVVAGGRDELARTSISAGECSWTGWAPPAGTECAAQLRAHGRPHPAVVRHADADALHLHLPEPSYQVAPGQSVVLYADDEVLGGGVIRAAA